MTGQNQNEIIVYVGTYTRSGSEGIYVYRFDPESGALRYLSATTGIENPSYLTLDSQQRYLYAVSEINEFEGTASGAVSSYSIDQNTGALTFLNQKPTHGTGPCYLVVDSTGRYVLVANYQSGSFCVMPIQPDGSLGDATDVIQHEGGSVNPTRQQGPHAHSINLDAANRYAVAADLGIDKMVVYRLDLDEGKLIYNSAVTAKGGAGPRHFDFHPNGRYGYLINELDSTLTAYGYDAGAGSLTEIETVSTLPEGFTGSTTCADVHVSPSGKFVYGSNRGHDSIVIFAIDEATGRLSYVGHESTQGQTPRNFAIDPTGAFLLAANQNSDSIVSYKIDQETGKLTPTGDVTQVPMPVCIKFMSHA